MFRSFFCFVKFSKEHPESAKKFFIQKCNRDLKLIRNNYTGHDCLFIYEKLYNRLFTIKKNQDKIFFFLYFFFGYLLHCRYIDGHKHNEMATYWTIEFFFFFLHFFDGGLSRKYWFLLFIWINRSRKWFHPEKRTLLLECFFCSWNHPTLFRLITSKCYFSGQSDYCVFLTINFIYSLVKIHFYGKMGRRGWCVALLDEGTRQKKKLNVTQWKRK